MSSQEKPAPRDIEKYRKGLVCLVPMHGHSGITSHEKTLCDCEVLEIFSAYDAAIKERDELKEKLGEYKKLDAGDYYIVHHPEYPHPAEEFVKEWNLQKAKLQSTEKLLEMAIEAVKEAEELLIGVSLQKNIPLLKFNNWLEKVVALAKIAKGGT